MPELQTLILAFALAADAVAVSISTCAKKQAPNALGRLQMALAFGFFQGLMPVLGYYLGNAGSFWLKQVDHWVAFSLLTLVGAKMLYEALKKDSDEEEITTPTSLLTTYNLPFKTLITLAIATSIDAAAIGISLSMLNKGIFISAITIAVVTFALSWLGAKFGKRLGEHFGEKAEIVGGLVLIGIGCKILFEHWT